MALVSRRDADCVAFMECDYLLLLDEPYALVPVRKDQCVTVEREHHRLPSLATERGAIARLADAPGDGHRDLLGE
jgi:hypothetical protein